MTCPSFSDSHILRTMVFMVLLCAAFTSTPSRAQDPRHEEFLADLRIEKDIIYKKVDGKKLDLWLFLPKKRATEPMPVMIYTHGGGWGGGNKFNILKPAFRGTLEHLLSEGVACAAIKYRLTRKGTSTAIDCVEDCKDAARFLVAKSADYHLDPTRMGVWGGSAGGHLALMTGLAQNSSFKGDDDLASHDPQFRCIAAYYPATTFLRPDLLKGSNFEKPERMTPMVGGLAKDHPDRVALLSPTEHLRMDSPPILLLHGDKDTVLPHALSEHLVEVAKNKGASVELLTVKGGKHSFGGKGISPEMDEINKHAATFILTHLRSPSGTKKK